MSELTVAARYAKSLIDLAGEQKIVEPVKNDMDLFLQTLKSSPELKALIANPIVPQQKKVKILTELFSSKMNKASIGFFTLMVNKGRGDVLYATANEFINLYDIKNNIIHASVVSATALSEANRKTMIADIQSEVGGTVKLDAKVDPS